MHLVKKYGRVMLFPGIICAIFLYFFLQPKDASEDSITITTIPQQQVEQLNSDEDQNEMEEPSSLKVMVDVKGAVKFPGVYELTTQERIIDAIELAGGYTDEAQPQVINHAQKLQDEMVIYVPTMEEAKGLEGEQGQVVSTPTSNTNSSSTKININIADEQALTTLPGIGPSKAQAILAYRDEIGTFKSIEELKNVSGIGDKTFEKLKDLIEVN